MNLIVVKDKNIQVSEQLLRNSERSLRTNVSSSEKLDSNNILFHMYLRMDVLFVFTRLRFPSTPTSY